MSKNILKKRACMSIIFIVLTICSYGQNKNRFPIWTFHEKNVNIQGISVGFWSSLISGRNTNTNGIRLELIGFGVFAPMAPQFPEFGNQRSERVNGLSLSALGTVCDCLINGLSAGLGQITYQVNGISVVPFMNITQKHNGIMLSGFNVSDTMNGLQLGFNNGSSKTNGVQIAFLINETEEMKGLQIGLFNNSKNLRGIQIGLWNVNQKRKLPLINWNFKRTAKKNKTLSEKQITQ